MVAERLHRRNYLFGVPVLVLSAIVGTSIFATLTADVGLWSRVLVGAVSITVAVLSALQTFFRFTERAEQHREAAIQYGILNRELERICALPPSEQVEAQTVLVGVEKKFNDLAQQAPAIPGALWTQIPHELTPTQKE